MKKKNFICSLLIASSILLTTGCSKDDNSKQSGPVPILSTSSISIIRGTSATCGGDVTTDNGLTVTARGVCWSTNSSPTIADDTTFNSVGAGSFKSKITGLNPKTQYFVRAYATNSAGTGYGSAMSFTTTEITVGESYQGGIVIYLFNLYDHGYIDSQSHGLIATSTDQSVGATWGCNGTLISGSSSESIGYGKENTSNIVSQCSINGIAAKICDDLVLNQYNDWFLPTENEAYRMFSHMEILNLDYYAQYWTSTQTSSAEAQYAWTGVSNPYNHGKDNLHKVRACRYF